MNRTLDVTVYSKMALSEGQINQIKTKLVAEHQREIKIMNIIDSSIIAGYKYEYEGYVIDETVNRQLDNLKQHLKK